MHIVSGPWYAYPTWRKHERTIWLDRCYYKGDPDHVSLGWARPDGGRTFVVGEGKESPVPKPAKTGDKTIFLADYQGPVEQADTVRLHPAEQTYTQPLVDAIAEHDHAIGYDTTALVTAGLMGLSVECRSPTSIMAMSNWLEVLPWADWHYTEIESGEAWETLLQQLP